MPVGEPHVEALSPDTEGAACPDRNHQAADGLNPEADNKPDWLERLEKAAKSRGNAVLMGGEEYRLGKRLGEGAFGVVFVGDKLSKEGSIPVAVKFVSVLPRLTMRDTKQRLIYAETRNRGGATTLSYETSIAFTEFSLPAVNSRRMAFRVFIISVPLAFIMSL